MTDVKQDNAIIETSKKQPHRWKKGETGNPNGRPKNAEIDMLRNAILNEGNKQKKSFWDVVAKKAFVNPTIMLAVLKKFVPDLTHQQLEGKLEGRETKIIIVRSGESIQLGNHNKEVSREVPVQH